MDIKTYDLIIDTKTKHTALQVKDSFAYAVDNFTEPKAIYDLMTDGFHMDEKQMNMSIWVHLITG